MNHEHDIKGDKYGYNQTIFATTERINRHAQWFYKNWKEVAKTLTDAGEKWIQNSGNYDIYSDKIGFGFTCGEEEGTWEFFSSVGTEVKEFSSKLELLNFIKNLGLPLDGLEDPNIIKTTPWIGDGYYFRHAVTKGYVKVLVTSFDISIGYYPLEYRFKDEGVKLNLGLDATEDEIRTALKQVVSAAESDENKINKIVSTCPVDKLKR